VTARIESLIRNREGKGGLGRGPEEKQLLGVQQIAIKDKYPAVAVKNDKLNKQSAGQREEKQQAPCQ
jgi:hypothetical protein